MSPRNCIVRNCTATDEFALFRSFYTLPSEQRTLQSRKDWLKALKITTLPDNNVYFVCDRHFESRFIGTRGLLKGAVPTLYLNIGESLTAFDESTDRSIENPYDFQCENLEMEIFRESESSTTNHQNLPMDDDSDDNMDSEATNSGIELRKLNMFKEEIIFDQNSANFYNKESVCDNCESTDASMIEVMKINRKLSQMVISRDKQIAAQNEELERLKKEKKDNYNHVHYLEVRNNELKALKKRKARDLLIEHIDNCPGINQNTKVFVSMLLKSKKRYSDDDKILLLTMFNKSPSLYKLLRNVLDIPLAHPSSIKNWNIFKYVAPGIENHVKIAAKQKVSQFSEEQKQCAIVFDAMTVDDCLYYNEKIDCVVGFEDCNGIRTKKIADHATFFLLRGLLINWKFPVAYHLSKNDIQDLCIEIGLKVRVIVCDQGSPNMAAFRQLGVTVEKPYFEYKGNTYFCIFDASHLIKSSRNIFFNDDICVGPDTVSKKVVVATYNEDQKYGTSKIPRITFSHIYPTTFDRMRVKKAVQICSRSFSIAILSTFKKNKNVYAGINDSTVFATAKYLNMMNNIFDVFNSRNLQAGNPLKKSLTRESSAAKDFMFEFLDYIDLIKVKSSVQCIKGWAQTVKGVLGVTENLFAEFENLKEIPLFNFLSDPIENMFSAFRGDQGWNRNPTCHALGFTVGKLYGSKYLHGVDLANCIPDNVDTMTIEKICLIDNPQNDQNEDVDEWRIESLEMEYDFMHRDFDFESIRYVTGFVAKNFRTCEQCKEILVKELSEDPLPSEEFICSKTFEGCTNGGLTAPSDKFFELCVAWTQLFEMIFYENPHIKNVRVNIKRIILNSIQDDIRFKWFFSFCGEHNLIILDNFIKLMIRFTIKRRLSRITEKPVVKKKGQEKSSSFSLKLKNLTNKNPPVHGKKRPISQNPAKKANKTSIKKSPNKI